MDAPTIRRATPFDAHQAAVLFTRARKAAEPAIPPSIHTPDEDEWFVGEILIGERETWVAELDTAIVGILTLDGDDLDQLYLAPEATGHGLGSRFVELAKEERPHGLELWCFESNVRAQKFYEQHGFVEVGRTDGAGNENAAPDIRYRWVP